jgi:hypothetical protein
MTRPLLFSPLSDALNNFRIHVELRYRMKLEKLNIRLSFYQFYSFISELIGISIKLIMMSFYDLSFNKTMNGTLWKTTRVKNLRTYQ